MKNYIYLIISVINAGLMSLYISLFVSQDRIPLHFDFNGNADRYGSKWELLILAGIPFVLSLIYAIINLVINYMKTNSKNEKYISKIFGGIFLFLLIVFWAILLLTTNETKLSNNLIFSLFTITYSMLFIFIGNLLPKLKPNSIAGLRTKATMSSEYVWKKANRISGYVAVAVGISGVISGFICLAINSCGIWFFGIFLSVFIIAQIIVAIYANMLSKKGYPNG